MSHEAWCGISKLVTFVFFWLKIPTKTNTRETAKKILKNLFYVITKKCTEMIDETV